MKTKVTGKNQITIPAKIAATHDIEAGTQLEWRTTGKKNVLEVQIHPSRGQRLAMARRIGRKTRFSIPDAVDKLVDERMQDEVERESSL